MVLHSYVDAHKLWLLLQLSCCWSLFRSFVQLSVDTSEHNMNRRLNPDISSSLRGILQSFRGAYNRSNAERLLARISHVQSAK
jgi:hypothetical protein